jgi:NO-binding membrane sensor protein with MHYT domain
MLINHSSISIVEKRLFTAFENFVSYSIGIVILVLHFSAVCAVDLWIALRLTGESTRDINGIVACIVLASVSCLLLGYLSNRQNNRKPRCSR